MANHLGHSIPWNTLDSLLQFDWLDEAESSRRFYRSPPLDAAADKQLLHFARRLEQTIAEFEATAQYGGIVVLSEEQAAERDRRQAEEEAESSDAADADRWRWWNAVDRNSDELNEALFLDRPDSIQLTSAEADKAVRMTHGGQGCPGGVRYTTLGVLQLYILLNLALLNPGKYRRFLNPDRYGCLISPASCAQGETDGAWPECIASEARQLWSSDPALLDAHEVECFRAQCPTFDWRERTLFLRRFDAETTQLVRQLHKRLFRRLVAHNCFTRAHGLDSAEDARMRVDAREIQIALEWIFRLSVPSLWS